MGPAAGPVHGGDAAHALEGVDGGLDDGRRAGGHGLFDEEEGVGVVEVGEVAQGGAAGSLGAVLGRLHDLGAVLGPGHGGQTAGGGDMERGSAFDALLGPLEDGLDAPAGAGSARTHLTLPAVETAGLLSGTHARGDVLAGILGPQPPGPWFEGVPYGGGEFGLALGIGGEPCEHGCREGSQTGVVVPQGEFVEGPGPVGS